MSDVFRKLSHTCAIGVGSSWTFLVAVLVVVVWAVTGPVFHYSDTWQLVINTGTSVITRLREREMHHEQRQAEREHRPL